jgi:hypothetical protein
MANLSYFLKREKDLEGSKLHPRMNDKFKGLNLKHVFEFLLVTSSCVVNNESM